MSATTTVFTGRNKTFFKKNFIWDVLWMTLFAVVVIDDALYVHKYYYIDTSICIVVAAILVVWAEYLMFMARINDACRRETATEEKLTRLRKEVNEWKKWRKKCESNWEKDQAKAQDDWRREQETIKQNILKEFHDHLVDQQGLYRWLATIITDVESALMEKLSLSSQRISYSRSYDTQLKANTLRDMIKALKIELKIKEYELMYVKKQLLIAGDARPSKQCNLCCCNGSNPPKNKASGPPSTSSPKPCT
ncbi:hypothetical protein R80B4_01505 [Fibrobacteres bacterium R8-0-B4]